MLEFIVLGSDFAAGLKAKPISKSKNTSLQKKSPTRTLYSLSRACVLNKLCENDSSVAVNWWGFLLWQKWEELGACEDFQSEQSRAD